MFHNRSSANWMLVLAALASATGCDPGKRSAQYDVNRGNAAAISEKLNVGGGAAGPASAAQASDGYATIRGRFVVQGSPPALPALAVSGGDTSICAPGGQQPPNESIVVGADGSLANVLFYLDMKVPDIWQEHPDHAARKEAELRGAEGFDQKACVFLSHVYAMRSTQKVEIINSDPVGHNTNLQPSRGAKPQNNTLPAMTSALYEPGGASNTPFPVSCAIHNWMKAYMITLDHPYFAVTKKDGTFEIKDVPAGVDLTFRVWQENAGYLQNVKVDGADVKWPRGRYKVKLEKDSTVELEVVIDASVFKP